MDNCEKKLLQNNSGISCSITQSWTEQAIECYSVGGNCKMCSLSKGSYSFECQMPKVIKILLETAGEPFQRTA